MLVLLAHVRQVEWHVVKPLAYPCSRPKESWRMRGGSGQIRHGRSWQGRPWSWGEQRAWPMKAWRERQYEGRTFWVCGWRGGCLRKGGVVRNGKKKCVLAHRKGKKRTKRWRPETQSLCLRLENTTAASPSGPKPQTTNETFVSFSASFISSTTHLSPNTIHTTGMDAKTQKYDRQLR